MAVSMAFWVRPVRPKRVRMALRRTAGGVSGELIRSSSWETAEERAEKRVRRAATSSESSRSVRVVTEAEEIEVMALL